MYSKKLFKQSGLPKGYIYHFVFNNGLQYYDCTSKQEVKEFLEKSKNNVRLYQLDIKYIDFTESKNFVKLLKIFSENYTVYNNWFKGKEGFENNFLYNLTRKLDLDWQFKKVRNIISQINQESWDYNLVDSYTLKI